MGRTNPTYRDFLRRYEDRWAPFRRALRRRYREDFDRLFAAAARHADAAGHANARDPETAAVLSILLAHETDRRELESRVAAIEDELGLDADAADGTADGATTGAGDGAGFAPASDAPRDGESDRGGRDSQSGQGSRDGQDGQDGQGGRGDPGERGDGAGDAAADGDPAPADRERR